MSKLLASMIGQNLKNLREKSSLSQAVLAKSLGVSRQAVCMWECGKREFGISTLVEIADIFNVSVDEIVRQRPKAKFELSAPSANEVLLIGDFNSWNASGMRLRKDKTGLWKLELELKPGRYEYKFIVDGKWQNDPLNANNVLNSYGTANSVKVVD